MREARAGYALPGNMGIGREDEVGLISGLWWTWRPFWATVVFLDADELGRGHVFRLPSIQIVEDDCKNLFVYNNFLHDAGRRGYEVRTW